MPSSPPTPWCSRLRERAISGFTLIATGVQRRGLPRRSWASRSPPPRTGPAGWCFTTWSPAACSGRAGHRRRPRGLVVLVNATAAAATSMLNPLQPIIDRWLLCRCAPCCTPSTTSPTPNRFVAQYDRVLDALTGDSRGGRTLFAATRLLWRSVPKIWRQIWSSNPRNASAGEFLTPNRLRPRLSHPPVGPSSPNNTTNGSKDGARTSRSSPEPEQQTNKKEPAKQQATNAPLTAWAHEGSQGLPRTRPGLSPGE